MRSVLSETATATAPKRETLLLNHANPENNEFTLWLALQLANKRYKVWRDLTKLLGGEVFWDDIEEVIRNTAVKVLFVLSGIFNVKDGPLRELCLDAVAGRKQAPHHSTNPASPAWALHLSMAFPDFRGATQQTAISVLSLRIWLMTLYLF